MKNENVNFCLQTYRKCINVYMTSVEPSLFICRLVALIHVFGPIKKKQPIMNRQFYRVHTL